MKQQIQVLKVMKQQIQVLKVSQQKLKSRISKVNGFQTKIWTKLIQIYRKKDFAQNEPDYD